MSLTVRNRGFAPNLESEGTLTKPMKIPPGSASDKMKVFDRLHYQQTLASVRRYIHFKPLPGLVPENELDFLLTAEYDHTNDLFPEQLDVVLQGCTIGTDTRRLMTNSVKRPVQQDAISKAVATSHKGGKGGGISTGLTPVRATKPPCWKYNNFHVLHIGGISEKVHPSYVKLMNSSHHSPLTNAGYTRQDNDGNAYQY